MIEGTSLINLNYIFWTHVNGVIKSQIYGSISSNVNYIITLKEIAYHMWMSIEQNFSNTSRVRVVIELKLQLQTLHKDSISINDYFNKMKGIVDELEATKRLTDDEDFIITIYSGLGPRYNHYTYSFNNRDEKLARKDVKSILLSYDNLFAQRQKVKENSICQENIANDNGKANGGGYKNNGNRQNLNSGHNTSSNNIGNRSRGRGFQCNLGHVESQ